MEHLEWMVHCAGGPADAKLGCNLSAVFQPDAEPAPFDEFKYAVEALSATDNQQGSGDSICGDSCF